MADEKVGGVYIEVGAEKDRAEPKRTLSQIRKDVAGADINVEMKIDKNGKARDQLGRFLTQSQREAIENGIDVPLDAKTEKAHEKIKHFIRDMDGEEIHLPVNPDTAYATARLKFLTRPRTVDIIAKMNDASMAKVATSIAALGGARVLDDFSSGLRDMVKNLDTAVPKVALLGTGLTTLGSGLLAGTSNIFALGGSLASIFPSFLALPGIAGAAGVGVGVLVAALKDAGEVLGDLGPMFGELQDNISASFWERAAQPIRDLATSAMPMLNTQLSEVANQFGGWATAIASVSLDHLSGFENTFKLLGDAIDISGDGVGAFTDGLLNLGEIGAQYLPRLADAFNSMSYSFQNWSQNADISGAIDAGITALKQLWDVGVQTVGILAAITKAAQASGGSGLGELASGLTAVNAALSGPVGQDTMVTLFTGAHQAMANLGPGVSALGSAFVALAPTISTAMQSAATSISGLLTGLSDALQNPVFAQGVTDMFSGIEAGVAALQPHMSGLGTIFGSLGSAIGALASAFGPVLGSAISALAPLFSSLSSIVSALAPVFSSVLVGAINAVAPVLATVASGIANFVTQFPGISAVIATVVGAIGLFISAAISIGTALAPVVGAVVSFIASAGGLSAAGALLAPILSGIGTALAAIAGPVGIVVAAIAVLGAAFVTALATSQQFRDAISQAFQAVIAAIQPVISAVLPVIMQIGQAFMGLVQTIMGALVPVMTTVVQIFAAIIQAATPVVTWLMSVLAPAFQFIGTAVSAAFEFIGTVVQQGLAVVQSVLQFFLSLLQGNWSQAWSQLGVILETVWTAITTIVQAAFQFLLTIVQAGAQMIVSVLQAIWAGLSAAVQFIWQGIVTIVQGVWTWLVQIVTTGAQNVVTFLQTAWATLTTVVSTIWQGIVTVVTTFVTNLATTILTWFNNARNFIQTAWSMLPGLISGIWSSIVSAVTSFLASIVSSILSGFNQARSFVQSAMSAISSTVSSIWSAIVGFVSSFIANIVSRVMSGFQQAQSFVSSAMNAIMSVISSIWSSITSFISSAISNVVSFISNGFNQAVSFVQNAMSQFMSAVQNGISNVISFMSGLPGRIMGAIGNLGGLLVDSGRAMIQGLADGIRGAVGAALDAAKGVVDKVRGLFPFSPAKEGPFSGRGYTTYSGKALMTDWGAGMLDAAARPQGAAKRVTEMVASEFAKTPAQVIGVGKNKVAQLVSGMNSQIPAARKAGQSVASALAAGMNSKGKSKVSLPKIADTAKLYQSTVDKISRIHVNSPALSGDQGRREWNNVVVPQLRKFFAGQDLGKKISNTTVGTLMKGLQGSAGVVQATQAQLRSAIIGQLNKNAANSGNKFGMGKGSEFYNIHYKQMVESATVTLKQLADKEGKLRAQMRSLGSNAGSGLAQGLRKQLGQIESESKRLSAMLLSSVRTQLDIHSPSRVMEKIGQFAVQGMVRGLAGSRSSVAKAMSTLTGEMTTQEALGVPQVARMARTGGAIPLPAQQGSSVAPAASQVSASLTDEALNRLMEAMSQMTMEVRMELDRREFGVAVANAENDNRRGGVR